MSPVWISTPLGLEAGDLENLGLCRRLNSILYTNLSWLINNINHGALGVFLFEQGIVGNAYTRIRLLRGRHKAHFVAPCPAIWIGNFT